ncbi:hypothetical protein BDW66DRAFT_162229 [Aspergillus desertorum]
MLSMLSALMRLLPALALLIAAATSTPAASPDDAPIDINALFGPVLSDKARVYVPGDPDYPGITKRWSNLQNPSRRCGQHCGVKPGYRSVRAAINIDLSLLKSIDLDYVNDTVTIGPGVTNNQVYNVVYDVQRELPLSTDKCISTPGTMIGGGLGTLQGVRGILAESLVSARLVTASGVLITVSQTQHPDLFWAIRGAGHSFGIVVSATFKMFEQTNGGWSLYGDFIIPAERNASAFELIRSVDEDLAHGVFWDILGGFNYTTMEPTLSLRLMVFGDEDYAAPHLAKAKALHPTSISWKNTTWNTYGEPSAIMCDRGWSADMRSTRLARTDVDTLVDAWNQWTAFAAEHEWFNGLWMQERLSEKVLMSVPEERRGVYPWMDTKVNFSSAPLRDRVQDVMGLEHRLAYVNEAYGDEGAEVWYSAHNLPQLVKMKQQWDPNGRWGRDAYPVGSVR